LKKGSFSRVADFGIFSEIFQAMAGYCVGMAKRIRGFYEKAMVLLTFNSTQISMICHWWIPLR
jgi:hypothetical protein